MKILSWSNEVFALLLHSPGSSSVSSTKACSVQCCTWSSLSFPRLIESNLSLSPKVRQARLYRSPLAREWSILLNILVALIYDFSSLNSTSVNVADQTCIWYEVSHTYFRGGQQSDEKKGTRKKKKRYNGLINMEKLKIKCKQITTSLPLSPTYL